MQQNENNGVLQNAAPEKEKTSQKREPAAVRKPKGLTVVECDCRECYWRLDRKGKNFEIFDPVSKYEQRRDVDLYHLCGVYGRMGVPADVREISYGQYQQYRPSDGIPRNFSDLVCEAVKNGNAALVPAGFCMYAPAVAGGVQRALGKDRKLGLVWIDAHSDNRIAEERESTTFVGIPVSAMAGQTCSEWRKKSCGLEVPLKGENMLLSDIRICDEEGLRNIENAGITVLTSSDFENSRVWDSAVEDLASRTDAIYLSVDMDILRHEYTPAYIKNVPGGHTIERVMRNVRTVTGTGRVAAFSLFCADFDRYQDQGEWTYFNAMKIIAAGLENWKTIPAV